MNFVLFVWIMSWIRRSVRVARSSVGSEFSDVDDCSSTYSADSVSMYSRVMTYLNVYRFSGACLILTGISCLK